jgi:hypothetical protein
MGHNPLKEFGFERGVFSVSFPDDFEMKVTLNRLKQYVAFTGSPEVWTGWASGFGIGRIAMLR